MNSIVINGITIEEGDVFARQGDVVLRYLGPANVVRRDTTVVKRTKLGVAHGESGHEHNLYACTDDGQVMTAPQGEGFNWLRKVTQSAPEFLTNFARGQGLDTDEELLIETGMNGAVLVHEASALGALDDDEHGPIPLPANSQIGIRHQQSTLFDQRSFVAD